MVGIPADADADRSSAGRSDRGIVSGCRVPVLRRTGAGRKAREHFRRTGCCSLVIARGGGLGVGGNLLAQEEGRSRSCEEGRGRLVGRRREGSRAGEKRREY